VKANHVTHHLPIIILSGSQATEDVDRCFKAGANAYLIKPGSPERLQELVQVIYSFWFDLGRLPGRTT
jgi:CheY-like chemotaxis protein